MHNDRPWPLSILSSKIFLLTKVLVFFENRVNNLKNDYKYRWLWSQKFGVLQVGQQQLKSEEQKWKNRIITDW